MLETLMTGCRDMDKKHQKYPQNGFFPHLSPFTKDPLRRNQRLKIERLDAMISICSEICC